MTLRILSIALLCVLGACADSGGALGSVGGATDAATDGRTVIVHACHITP